MTKRQNGCNGKVKHKDKTQANIVARKMNKKDNGYTDGIYYRAYHCKHCLSWHVGSVKKWHKKGAQKRTKRINKMKRRTRIY